MKLNNRIIWIIAIVLAFSAFFLILNRSKTTFSDAEKDFAVEDTAIITKIFMANRLNQQVTLKRLAPGTWQVNNEFLVSKPVIGMFLNTIKNVAVKEPVPVAAKNNILKIMAPNAVKVEIYQIVPRFRLFGKSFFSHETRTKVYYVGDATQDNMGTYMLMEDSEIPFITFLPGLRGFISSRYSPRYEDWRDHSIFSSPMNEIASVTLEFPEFTDQSYRVDNKGEVPVLIPLITNQPVSAYDTLRMISFLNSFGNIKYEAFLNYLPKQKIDSVIRTVPFHIITVTDKAGKKTAIKTFRMHLGGMSFDENGDPMPYDRDRMYALVNDGKDFVLIQFYVFDKIIRPLGYFLRQEPTPGKK
jgi:hypothetical protein